MRLGRFLCSFIRGLRCRSEDSLVENIETTRHTISHLEKWALKYTAGGRRAWVGFQNSEGCLQEGNVLKPLFIRSVQAFFRRPS